MSVYSARLLDRYKVHRDLGIFLFHDKTTEYAAYITEDRIVFNIDIYPFKPFVSEYLDCLPQNDTSVKLEHIANFLAPIARKYLSNRCAWSDVESHFRSLS